MLDGNLAPAFGHPTRIVFGAGRLSELPKHVERGATLLVTTPGWTKRGVPRVVRDLLSGSQVDVFDRIRPNPELTALDEWSAKLSGNVYGTIVAVGGGSVLDTAKVLGITMPGAAQGFSLRSHFETARPLPATADIPVVAVPTTAGTGSEVTPFATVWDTESGAKHSLATPRLLPRVALLDPELTADLPEDVTVAAGLDCISQGLESIWNRHAVAETLSLATEALRLALPSLPSLLAEPRNPDLRACMQKGSLLAGWAISRTRTALAHSMSYPLTARFGLPHGLACSFTLPAILAFNAAADDGRLAQVAEALGFASIKNLEHALEDLLSRVAMDQRLRAYGITKEKVLAAIPEMISPRRAGNNLRSVDLADLGPIIDATGRYLPLLRKT